MNNIKFTISLLSVLVCLFHQSTCSALDFEDCGSICNVYNFTIEGCNSDEVCYLEISSNVNVSFEIEGLQFQSQTLQNKVNFSWRGVNWPMSVTPEPCSVITCPTRITNESETYTAELNIDPAFMPMQGDLLWVMLGDGETQVLCIRKTVILSRPPASL